MTIAASRYDAFLLSRSDAACAVLDMERIAGHNGWKFAIFGGAARDILMKGEHAVPRDLDLVVDGATLADLQAELGFTDKTAFDGLKGVIHGVSVDIWPLDKTWAFSKMDLGRKPSFADLVWTTPFNLEAVVLEPAVMTLLHDGGFQKCMDEKVLELNYVVSADAFKALTLVRAALFSRRFALTFGPKLRDFIAKHYPRYAKALPFTQMSYYGKQMMSADTMWGVLNG